MMRKKFQFEYVWDTKKEDVPYSKTDAFFWYQLGASGMQSVCSNPETKPVPMAVEVESNPCPKCQKELKTFDWGPKIVKVCKCGYRKSEANK